MYLKLILLNLILLFVFYTRGDIQCLGSIGSKDFFVDEGLCVWKYTGGFNTPRQIITLSNNDALLIQGSKVTLLYDANNNGYVSGNNEIIILASATGLTHSVAYHNGYIYASSQSTIYRWPYDVSSRAKITTPAQIVISSIPIGNHITRTVVFDSKDNLYFSIGSAGNIDNNFDMARVYNCSVDFENIPQGGYPVTQCVPIYNGTRNEVGLRFDPNDVLWGVENGIDNLNRKDMTPSDISQDNPCEEINKFVNPGFYGYPYCFSEGILPANISRGAGSQWAVQKFIDQNKGINDTYCIENAIKPVTCMPAHSAPLDLIFYNSSYLPDKLKAGLFVTQHGSWNRNPPAGYQIVHFDVNTTDYSIVSGSMKKVVGAVQNGIKWSVRPVSMSILRPCGPVDECFLFTSDEDGSVYAFTVAGEGTLPPVTSSSSTTTTMSTTGNTSNSIKLFVNLLSTLLLILVLVF